MVIVAGPNAVANAMLCWQAHGTGAPTRETCRCWSAPRSLGAFLGTFLLVTLPEDPLLVLLAATIVVFVVSYLRSPELRLRPETTHRWSPVVGSLAGVMQGALGVSGPVVGAWMHGYRLTSQAYVFSVTLIFGVSGSVQLGLLTADRPLHRGAVWRCRRWR